MIAKFIVGDGVGMEAKQMKKLTHRARPKLRRLPQSSMHVLEGRQLLSTTYYVSPLGSNDNPGTSPDLPWADVNKVAATVFKPGDAVFFEGGATFNGTVYFDSQDVGTATAPITVGSYGTGRATINAGTGVGVLGYNTGGFNVSNLNVVGVGSTTNKVDGIEFFTDKGNNFKFQHVWIDSVDVSGFGDSGIAVGGWNGASGYADIRISNAISHDNAKAGINIFGQKLYSNWGVNVNHCTVYNNTGIASSTISSGNGIVLSSVSSGSISRNIAHDNGGIGNGNVGIWSYDSTGVLIQYNESYNNHTAGNRDGGGFAVDGGSQNAIVQYNYSHGNDGAGYGFFQYANASYWSGNQLRYNISENDGRKNGYSGIMVWNGGSGINNAEIYNNTVYMSPSVGAPMPKALLINTPTNNVHVRNNIFVTTGIATLVEVVAGQKGIAFHMNDYWSGTSAFQVKWAGKAYTNLTAWRNASGVEILGGKAIGYNVDPGFTSMGGGVTVGNSDLLYTLPGYKLLTASKLIDKGLNLKTMGINAGLTDFDGTTLYKGAGYEIGADEYLPPVPAPPIKK